MTVALSPSTERPLPAHGNKAERRTQAERSETMRQRLIEATLECLVSEGYAGITIANRVAEPLAVTL